MTIHENEVDAKRPVSRPMLAKGMDARAPDQLLATPRSKLMIFALLLMLSCLFVWAILSDPLIAYHAQAFIHPSPSIPAINYTDAMTHDPPLGAMLPNIGNYRLLARTASKSKLGCLVIYVGDCSSCIGIDLPGLKSHASSIGLQIVLLSSMKPTQTKEFYQHFPFHLPVVMDPDKQIIGWLNVLWPGRSYLFSTQGRLQWIDQSSRTLHNPFTDPKLGHILGVGE